MDDSKRQRWLGAAILAAALYPAMAIAASNLAGSAPGPMRFVWRLSAFVGSGVVFAAHIAYDHSRLRSTTRSTAWHTSAAVAFGGFALALAANIHDLGSAAGYRPRMLIALVAWPLLTAVPAFVVAMIVAAVLARGRRVQGDRA